jgi:uncharacterized phosphosugar-binding protein
VSLGPLPAGLPPARYLDELSAALGRARLANQEALAAAARIVEGVICGDGIVYVFGSGHSQLAALELNRRAGSIAAVQVLFDPTWGAAEHLEGYGQTLVGEPAPGRSDCLIAISHSGNTATAIDLALEARASGCPVIAVTSISAAGRARPRHACGLKLSQLADVVLDDGAADVDPGISVHGMAARVGPTSTIVAGALLHEIVVDAVSRLAARGLEVPVIMPNSADGGPQHNARLRDRYRGRVRIVP